MTERNFGKSTALLALISNLEERLERNSTPVPISGCVLWCAATTNGGYGKLQLDQPKRRTNWLAHRVAYFVYNGWFDERLDVLHECDVPACISRNHLFLGTAVDNSRDRSRKGRAIAPFGDAHYEAKIGAAAVIEIFRLRVDGVGTEQIASLLRISRQSVADIINRRTWKHVAIDSELLKSALASQRKSSRKVAQ